MTPALTVALFAVAIATVAVGIALYALNQSNRPGITLVVDPSKLTPNHPDQPMLLPVPGVYLPYKARLPYGN